MTLPADNQTGLRFEPSNGAEFGRVAQFAIHAPDIEAAARQWAGEMGAGPFYLFEHIRLDKCLYHGRAARFDHSSAYGQLGDMMIELIHQHDNAPSAIRDMYDERTPGLHHIAVMVGKLDEAVSLASAQSMACALDATTSDGVRFVMVDARKSAGCMLELYEPTPPLAKFYAFIKRKAESWDGADPLRRL
jgi:hypothetical protein